MATSTPSTGLSGYIFECCCGERFNNVAAASVCKKCRTYSVWGYTKYVINIETDEVVHGELPTDEEYADAAAAAEQRWCDELADEIRQEWWDQLDAEEAEGLEQLRMQAEEAAKLQQETEEDRLWEEQDRMMGY